MMELAKLRVQKYRVTYSVAEERNLISQETGRMQELPMIIRAFCGVRPEDFTSRNDQRDARGKGTM